MTAAAAMMACERDPVGNAAARADAVRAAVPCLRTERLVLRAPSPGDFGVYAEIACGDRGRWLGGPMTREDAWLDFAQMAAGWVLQGHGSWAISLDGVLQGFVLLGLEPGDLEPELGFMVSAKAEGLGIAGEAAQAALEHARNDLRLGSLVSYIASANARAQALALRLGASRDGEIREPGEDANASEDDVTLVFRHDIGQKR